MITKTKKILCLIDGLGFGGAQRQMITLVSLLKQEGYQIDLACYHERHFYDELLTALGISPILLPAKSKWSKFRKVRKLIKDNAYDVVITYMDGPNIIGCLLRITGLRFKLIVSDRITCQSISNSVFIRSQMYRFANYIVPNSYSQTEFLINNFSFLQRKIITITNSTDTTKFLPAKHSCNYPRKVLIAGRIATQKNIPNLIEALILLKHKSLPIKVDWYGNIGKGMEEYNKKVMDIYEKSDIKEILTFHPGSKNIVSLYQNCDIFCLPSLYEGFPNVVCEAMCCGKPILCSDVCDNSRLVKDGVNGFLFDPKDPETIAKAFIRFCELNEEEIYAMGKKSREMAEEICSTDTFVNKYINLIES